MGREARNFDLCLCWPVDHGFLLMMSLFICCSHVVALLVAAAAIAVVLVGRASAICC